MSLALTRRIKDLEEVVRKLDARVLLLEMQKRPVEAIGDDVAVLMKKFIAQQAEDDADKERSTRRTITLRGKAA